MFVVIWEYELRPGVEAAFAALHGADGAWAGLFREHAGYIDTQLLRGEQPCHYLTIDRWTSALAYDRFLDVAHLRYAQINAVGDTLTRAERQLGRYETPC